MTELEDNKAHVLALMHARGSNAPIALAELSQKLNVADTKIGDACRELLRQGDLVGDPTPPGTRAERLAGMGVPQAAGTPSVVVYFVRLP